MGRFPRLIQKCKLTEHRIRQSKHMSMGKYYRITNFYLKENHVGCNANDEEEEE